MRADYSCLPVSEELYEGALFMYRKDLFIHLSPIGILRYMMEVLNAWNIRFTVIRSHGRNSWYIKLELGTPDQPISIHIRISDHDAVYGTSLYDFDILCWSARKGAHGIRPITYLRLLEILAIQLNREIPSLCRDLLGYRKEHSLELQYNRRYHTWRSSGKRAKFYINAS
jgi:hypothetical protein